MKNDLYLVESETVEKNKKVLETIIGLLLIIALIGVLAYAGSQPRKLRTVDIPVIGSYEFLNNVEFTEIEDSLVYTGIQVETLSKFKDAKQHIVVSNINEPVYDRTKLVSIATDKNGNVYYQPMSANGEFRKFNFDN